MDTKEVVKKLTSMNQVVVRLVMVTVCECSESDKWWWVCVTVVRVMPRDDMGMCCSELQAMPTSGISYQCNVWYMLYHHDAMGIVHWPNRMEATPRAKIAESTCAVYNVATGRKDWSQKIRALVDQKKSPA